MQTIIDLLLSKNITFSVAINNISFDDEIRQEYFIIIKKSDLKQVETEKIISGLTAKEKKVTCIAKNGFKGDLKFKDYTFKTLNLFETNHFKSVKHKFKKVLHNEHGRVYEKK